VKILFFRSRATGVGVTLRSRATCPGEAVDHGNSWGVAPFFIHFVTNKAT